MTDKTPGETTTPSDVMKSTTESLITDIKNVTEILLQNITDAATRDDAVRATPSAVLGNITTAGTMTKATPSLHLNELGGNKSHTGWNSSHTGLNG